MGDAYGQKEVFKKQTADEFREILNNVKRDLKSNKQDEIKYLDWKESHLNYNVKLKLVDFN